MFSQYGMAIGNIGPVLLSFFLSFFNFAFFVVRDKVEVNKYPKIDKNNNQPS